MKIEMGRLFVLILSAVGILFLLAAMLVTNTLASTGLLVGAVFASLALNFIPQKPKKEIINTVSMAQNRKENYGEVPEELPPIVPEQPPVVIPNHNKQTFPDSVLQPINQPPANNSPFNKPKPAAEPKPLLSCPYCNETQKNEHVRNMHIISKHKEEYNKKMGL